jgi:8-oxo-dGTP diphosphatase
MSYTYRHPRPSVTVDCVVFGLDMEHETLDVLLIKRKEDPYSGSWALPGGFVHVDESIEDAAQRELTEETGLKNIFLEQLYTYGEPGRDPRGRVISVAHFALVPLGMQKIQADSDAADAAWFSMDDLPGLAFDHHTIIETALQRLKGKVRYQPVGFELLPDKFTLTMLQKMYEIILDHPLDKRNFRKKITGSGFLVELDEIEKDVAHRAARLYSFDPSRYRQLVDEGFTFSI